MTNISKDVEVLQRLRDLIHEPDLKGKIRGQINTLHAQANAAVFLGAVQAQLLQTDNSTRLKTATNTLFLVGILFNVIGAYYALTTASSLESDLHNIQAELEKWQTNSQHKPEGLSTYGKDLAGASLIEAVTLPTDSKGDNNVISFERTCQSIRRSQSVGSLAYNAISLGFLACPAALLCLAFDQGPLAMKISAPAVVVILLIIPLACSLLYRHNTDSMFR